MTTVAIAAWSWSNWLTRSRAWTSILIMVPIGMGSLFAPPRLQPGSWGYLTCFTLGYIAFALGAGMRWWSTLYIGGRKTLQVVNTGPYSICRNPIYFGSWLMSVAIALMAQSIVFGVALLCVGCYYLAVTIPTEERKLAKEFPASYAEYLARVPRFFPRFAIYESPEVLEVRLSGLRAELIRTLRWIWIPVICLAAAHFRLASWWPHWTNWP